MLMDCLLAQMQRENVSCSVLKQQLKDGLVRCGIVDIKVPFKKKV